MTISSVFGIHANICSLQLSFYYGHEKCLSCLSKITSSSLKGLVPVAINKLNGSVPTTELLEAFVASEYQKARATSFILLLGVGSFLCYKFYLQLKKKISKKDDNSRASTPSVRSCGAPESLHRASPHLWSPCDSLLDDDDISLDPENIELRYFGPDCAHDDATLSLITDFSEDASFPSSLISCSDSENGLDQCSTSLSSDKMGNFNSRFSEPVFYNVDTGIHFKEPPDQRTKRIAQQLHSVLSPSRNQKLAATVNRLITKQERPPTRPNHLPLENVIPQSSQRIRPEISGLSFSSNLNDSSAFPSELESLCGSWSYEDQNTSNPGSLKGNFSPASLRHKFLRLGSLDQSPDQYGRANSIDSFNDDGSDLSRQNSAIRTSGGESMSIGCLTREISIDSFMSDDASEFGSLENATESIAIETLENFKDIEHEMTDLKHMLLDLDSDLLKMQSEKSFRLFSSNIYCDTPDGVCDSPDSGRSAMSFVQKHKDRLCSRGLLSADGDRSKSRSKGASTDMDLTDSGSEYGQSISSDSPHRKQVSKWREGERQDLSFSLKNATETDGVKSMGVSMVSCESGFLDGMINSMESPQESSLDSRDPKMEFSEISFDCNSLENIEHINDIDGYLSEYSKRRGHRLAAKINELLKMDCAQNFLRFKMDNLGLLRAISVSAVAFQLKSSNNCGPFISYLKSAIGLSAEHPWLCEWVFLHNDANQESFNEKVKSCIETFTLLNSNCNLATFLNRDKQTQAKFLDAIKLIMIMSAIKLYETNFTHHDVIASDGPLFQFLLFSQKYIFNPETYYKRHLKYLGTNFTPNELDVYLLSYSLGITAKYIPLSSDEPTDNQPHPEFKYYPDCNIRDSHEITLVSDKESIFCCST